MPLYYFDLDSGGRVATDSDGLDLASLEVARSEALNVLAQVVRDGRQMQDEQRLACTIRDDAGAVHRVELLVRSRPLP